MKNNDTKICLTIAGLDPSGGAGIAADIKAFSAFGCFPTAAITSITFQNTQGVFGAEHQTAQVVRGQLEPVFDDFEVSALKTGMLPTEEVINEVAKIISENDLSNLVVDPVVRSTSGFDLIDDRALRSLVENLFPRSDLITPNLPEAERIARMKISSEEDISAAAKKMHSLGARNVLIKGGHGIDFQRKGKASDFLFTGDGEPEIFEADFIQTSATHGTGCTLASAITANLALDKPLSEAIGIAKKFVTKAIRNAPNIGRGNSPIGF